MTDADPTTAPTRPLASMSPAGRTTLRAVAVVILAIAALAIAACGSDPANSSGPVAATLKEHTVSLSRDTAKAGSVTFQIKNEGAMTHEFVVFKTDLAPDALPLDEEGAVDEKGEGVEFMDERENIKPGDTVALTLDLPAGNYVVLCNLEDHYNQGMYKAVTVTD